MGRKLYYVARNVMEGRIKMNLKKLSLNGTWRMDYLGIEPYLSEEEPCFMEENKGYVVENAVPRYWEDMCDEFRKTELHTKLNWNPLYTLQRYPQAGYVPDMALPNVLGTFVYERHFYIEQCCQTGTIELFVGGVQNRISAWLNGNFLGCHEGYSSSFCFSIPPSTLNEGENRIVLVVSNSRLRGYMQRPVSGLTSRAANECTGGIYGDVEIRIYEDGLKAVWVSTEENCEAFTVYTEGAIDREKQVSILDGQLVLCTLQIPAGQSQVTISAEPYTLWSPDMPKRYRVEVRTESQCISCMFGIRYLRADGTRLYLNGQPYIFRGVCEHCYHPITVHPVRDKLYYRNVIKTMKKLGFNAIRFHTYVPMAEYLEAADELGILIEIETPNNTSYDEWCDIVRFTRAYTSPVIYSSGNEMTIDEEYIEHLRACAKVVHEEGHALFSPMSAMRGVEYVSFGDCRVDVPFSHNPKRLAVLGEFCDVYNSYALRLTSYESDRGDYKCLEERNAVYNKPLLSHEICIHGTYCDLSLKDRYKKSRIGDTELFVSVERHLEEKGLLERAPVYYRNSVAWQQLLRKHCFETLRRTKNFAGYDFLGDIDTHWHTFGYCVGMMNEFYELKPGETVENVLRYNSDVVLLADLPQCRNLTAGSELEIPIWVSDYGKEIKKANLTVMVLLEKEVYMSQQICCSDIRNGAVTELYKLLLHLPECDKPKKMELLVRLEGACVCAENRWDLYVFPETTDEQCANASVSSKVTVTAKMTADELLKKMYAGERVLLFGTEPFQSEETSFQISVAGRTNGHLATVIKDHVLLDELPHDGFCGWQFREMMNGGRAAILDLQQITYDPIIEIATSYKNAYKEAVMFEYQVGAGKLFVCTLGMQDTDPGARWLKRKILEYTAGNHFQPAVHISLAELSMLCTGEKKTNGVNENEALNKNDITMN